MVTCQICQREFKSFMPLGVHLKSHKISKKEYYDKYLKKDNEDICPECGKETKFIILTTGYNKYCSFKCSNNSNEIKNKKKQTYLKKYGVNHPSKSKEIKEQYKIYCLKKYGVESTNTLDSVKEKKKQTYLKKYGVNHPSKSKEIKEQYKIYCLKKYGKNHHFKCKDILHKRIESRLINYYNNKILNLKTVKPLFSLKEYNGVRNNNKDIVYKWQCNICDNIFEDTIHSKLPRCLKCHPLLNGFSKQEKQVVSYIKSIYAGLIIENDRSIITPYELDIYLPELKLAIEYNGDYWHSIRPKNYHEMKTNRCQSKGIKLVHITENDWLNKQELIKDKIKNLI